MIQVAVLGYGTVGSGVVEVLWTNREVIAQRVGEELNVKYILDLRDFPGDPFEDRVVHDINVILADPEVKVICETMGGNEPARTFSLRALEAGISVCTSNKELVANHGPELMRAAREHHCSYLYEASVGGGIPVIRPLNTCLTAERVERISGILNGTTNYILTRMEEDGGDFAACLKEAQEKGYAEHNPEADVEGYDACRKIAILSSIMSGKRVDYRQIPTQGITKITQEDFLYAKALHASVKLLASAWVEDGVYYAMVSPALVDERNPLYAVRDVFNAVFIRGNTLGDSMYYGRGAGKLPTASAVVGDIIECAKNPGKTVESLWGEGEQSLGDIGSSKRRFLLRVEAAQAEALQEKLGGATRVDANIPGECGYVTEEMTEKSFAEQFTGREGVISWIRIED